MRDILLVIFLLFAIYFTFKKPIAGVAAWIWIALMAPAKWAFGFSNSLRLNLTIVFITAISYLVYKHKPSFKFDRLQGWVLFFGFWMLISSAFHLQVDGDFIWNKYIEFLKIITLFIFIGLIAENEKHINVIVWAIILGISAYAGAEAFKYLASGGSHRIVGKSGIIADRNDFAVAINMSLPLIIYAISITKHKIIKLGLIGLLLFNIIAIVGTYSRGGFIGLSILAFAFWLKSERKLLIALVFVTVTPIAYQFAPQEWKERQATIETATTEDGSFIGRLWAWKIATLIAIDNPMTGAGFKATTDPVLWYSYAPQTPYFGFIETPEIPSYSKPKAAHNIYFQVLGSAGFVGLFVFLMILLKAYLTSLQNAKRAKEKNIVWAENLSKNLSLALIGYGITGLNVSLAYFELVYIFVAMIIVIKAVIDKAESNATTSNT